MNVIFINSTVKLTVLAILAILFLGLSCTNRNEEDLFTDTEQCDTANMTFASDVEPILITNCYQCHSSADADINGAGLAFDSYESFKPLAESGLITAVIEHEPGYSPMPKYAAKLDTCSRLKIQAWIEQGFEK